jgi:hypothetical protein
MRVRVGQEFSQESERYDLRFTCEDCTFHRPERDACAHFWPDAEHRKRAQEHTTEVSFCKEFELS